jgi:RND family efflux transporter MFP subunit
MPTFARSLNFDLARSKKLILCHSLLCLCLTLSGCEKEAQPLENKDSSQIELITADLVQVSSANAVETAGFTGTIRAMKQSTIQAQVSATATDVLVDVGQQVQPNQVLVRLNNQDNQARLAQARANLAATQAQATQARNMMNRKKRLLDQGFISKVEYEQSQVDYQAQFENVEAQKANVNIALKAEQDGVIRSPIAGVITQRQVDVGQTVAIGQTLFEIIDPSQLELQAKIPSDQQNLLNIGQAIEFNLQGQSETFTAQVTRISPVADLNSRQLEFFARPQQTLKGLNIGSFVKGKLIAQQQIEGQSIPLNTIQKQGNQAYVWVIRQNKIQKANVEVLQENYNKNSAIVRGLEANDRVSRVIFQDNQINQAVIIRP